jgi:hypothetical protein
MVAASTLPAAPVLALMGFGVVVAIAGHAARARWLVITGLVILFLATAAMVVGGGVAFHGDQDDPRQEQNPREPTF